MAIESSLPPVRTSGRIGVRASSIYCSAVVLNGTYISSVNAARAAGAPAPLGDQSYDPAKAVHMLDFDNSKSIKLLGLKYRGIQETTSDIVEDLKARGWL